MSHNCGFTLLIVQIVLCLKNLDSYMVFLKIYALLILMLVNSYLLLSALFSLITVFRGFFEGEFPADLLFLNLQVHIFKKPLSSKLHFLCIYKQFRLYQSFVNKIRRSEPG